MRDADARLSRDMRVQVRGERELVSCELEAVQAGRG